MIITLRVSLSSRPKSSNWREQRPSSFAPDNHDDDHFQGADDDDDDGDDDDDYVYGIDYADDDQSIRPGTCSEHLASGRVRW